MEDYHTENNAETITTENRSVLLKPKGKQKKQPGLGKLGMTRIAEEILAIRASWFFKAIFGICAQ